MTPEDVAERVGKIAIVGAEDAEEAHLMEDRLRHEVLMEIKDTGDETSRALADAVVRTSLLDFPRWYA